MEKWVSYFNEEQYGYSESLKKELSKQLGARFKYKLECDNLFEKYFFNLFLGMNEIQIREKDGYVFPDLKIQFEVIKKFTAKEETESLNIIRNTAFANKIDKIIVN